MTHKFKSQDHAANDINQTKRRIEYKLARLNEYIESFGSYESRCSRSNRKLATMIADTGRYIQLLEARLDAAQRFVDGRPTREEEKAEKERQQNAKWDAEDRAEMLNSGSWTVEEVDAYFERRDAPANYIDDMDCR